MMVFNELQHQLFNYLIHSREKDDGTIEYFIKGLCGTAVESGVSGDFGWALKSSLERSLREECSNSCGRSACDGLTQYSRRTLSS